MQLHGKRVLVTGASGGIGQALCAQLSKVGANVLMNGMQESTLRALQQTLGLQHAIVVADISDQNGRESIVQASRQFAGVDVVINLAGILDCNFFGLQDNAIIDRIMQVNAVAPMLLIRQLLPLLHRKPSARIVNVGSIFGSIGHPGFTAYCASKAALKMFSEALARELADTNISVGYIAPRATDTDLNSNKARALNQALGNFADTPESVAREILHLSQGNGRVRYLGWPENFFVRLNAVLPSVVHHALVKKLDTINTILGRSGV